jgi:condensin complex subunit 1
MIGVLTNFLDRVSPSHPTCDRLKSLILEPTSSPFWFSFAEQSINAIYCFSESPDSICGEIIKSLTAKCFNVPNPNIDSVENMAKDFESNLNLNEGLSNSENISSSAETCFHLSQLLFIVGHVAIRQIVHLELIEMEWKRRKALKDSEKSNQNQNDLEMVTGTVEDEFMDCISSVREKELLFSNEGLFSTFGSMIVHICTYNQQFNVPFY